MLTMIRSKAHVDTRFKEISRAVNILPSNFLHESLFFVSTYTFKVFHILI